MNWLISVVLNVVVIGLVAGLFLWAVATLPLIPDVIRQILRVFIIVVVALSVIGMLFGYFPAVHFPRIGP